MFLSIVQNYIPQKTKFRKELNSAKLHSARSRPLGMCGIFYKVSKFYLSAVYLNLKILTAPARDVGALLFYLIRPICCTVQSVCDLFEI